MVVQGSCSDRVDFRNRLLLKNKYFWLPSMFETYRSMGVVVISYHVISMCITPCESLIPEFPDPIPLAKDLGMRLVHFDDPVPSAHAAIYTCSNVLRLTSACISATIATWMTTVYRKLMCPSISIAIIV